MRSAAGRGAWESVRATAAGPARLVDQRVRSQRLGSRFAAGFEPDDW